MQPNKIAYSAHEYGPYVYQQGWFFAKDFPRSLRRIMTDRWGSVMEKGVKPVWVGEFGSFYPKPDSNLNRIERQSFETVIAYIQRVSTAHYCGNVLLYTMYSTVVAWELLPQCRQQPQSHREAVV